MRTFKALLKMNLAEMLFDRVFYTIFAITVFIIVLGLTLGAMSFSEKEKILADFGFFAAELAAVVMGAFYGSYSMAKEIEKQTCLMVLARPISRAQFIIAKFFSVCIFNAILVFTTMSFVSFFMNTSNVENLLLIAMSICLKAAIITGLSFVFANGIRPIISLCFSMTIYLLGHWLGDLMSLYQKNNDTNLLKALEILNYVCPNFYRMNLKSWYFTQAIPTSVEVLWMFVHAIAWIVLCIFLMQLFFRRKNIV